MKNYLVKATMNFNDTVEKTDNGADTPRVAGQSTWKCTKERYEFLKSHNAVVLLGIDKEETKEAKIVEEPKTVEATIEYPKEPVKPKATIKLKNKKVVKK